MADKIIGVTFGTFALLFVGLPLSFIGLLTLHTKYLYFLIVAVLSIYLLIVLKTFGFFKTKRRKLIVGVVVGIIVIWVGIPAAKQLYDDNISTVSSEVNIYEYQPFYDDSVVVKMDEETTLKLEDQLPILDGATAMYPLYAAFVQATYPENQNYLQDEIVMVSTTPYAYNNLFEGKADVIFAAGPSELQRKAADDNGLKLDMTPIGREAFVFFVNKKNPIDSLTLEQIRGIYSGEITNWSQVGGNNEEIRAFQRPQDSGSQTAL